MRLTMFWATFTSSQTYAMTNRNATKDLCASALKCVAFAMSQNMISLIVVGFYLVNLSAQRGAERRKAMLFSSTSEGGKDH